MARVARLRPLCSKMIRPWIFVAAAFVQIRVQGACLPDAIDASQRRNLTRGDGASYPVGLFTLNWAASLVTTGVAHVLIEERMGYNVLETGTGSGTIEGFYALFGCLQPNNITNRGCGPSVTYSHIALEAWPETYVSEWAEVIKQNPAMAPVILGSMGYDGTTGIFFPSSSLNSAYYTEGIALEFYRGWNYSWSQSWKYFDSVASIGLNLVLPCVETRFQISKVNEDYIRYTGDMDGVDVLPNGDLVARCPDGHFWLAPGCRADSSKCVPYVTGGSGWWLDDTMQKATAYDIPMALGVARDLGALPKQRTTTFYAWVPDTSFFELQPASITFPPNDINAHLNGDKRTAAPDSLVAKVVSQDLSSLSPRLEDFLRNMRYNLKNVNDMMGDLLKTGDSHRDVACRWLLDNRGVWESWLPDETKCFPGFGLYDTNLSDFISNRDNPTFLECRACESGRFSSRLDDVRGFTYECKRCAPGTSQPSGAALQCEKCNPGEYQSEVGKQACNRCEIGYYQDEPGSPLCVVCPSGTTLGLGSVSLADCGCEAGFIDQAGDGNLSCLPCGPGLDCPALGSLTSLESGSSPLGINFVPKVKKDFYSSPENPLMLFRCLGAGRCPGGRPGSCAGGLQYRACTECPQGQVFSTDSCQNCTVWQQAGWVLCLLLIFLGLVVAYYMLTLQSTAKASVLFTTACAFGLTISSLQSVGIVGMMTVDFPVELRPIFDLLQVFVLDIDSLAFSCIAGNSAPARYTSSVLFFPAMVLWLVVCSFASRWLPSEFRWERSKTCSVIGALLQVGFSTMSSISMAPLMCFSHPNGVHSLLKYPSVTCGTADHAIMLAMGLLLLIVGVLGFLALCTYAVVLSPRWSAQGHHTKVRAFRFLLFRFRLDSWWFGVPLLIRGPLLSLPIALATDYPPIQVMAMSSVFIVFLALECRAWPWKVPLLNVMDALLCLIMTLLVGSTSLHLGPIEGEMKDFASILASVLMGCLGLAMASLLFMTVSALVYRAALGGQQELVFFNLHKQPSSAEVSERLKASAARIRSMEESDLLQAVGLLSVYDLGLVVSYMSMAHSEIAATEAGDELQMHRICSHSFAPPKPKLRKMKKPSDLGRRLRLTVQRLTAEMDTGRPSLLQDELPSEDGMGASFSNRLEAAADNDLKDLGPKPKEL
ncbi:unnamed protein product, partial [Symbiodinium sp. CCMP2592]